MQIDKATIQTEDIAQTQAVAPVKQEIKHLGSIKIRPGQKLYKLDLKAYEINEATVVSESIMNMDGTTFVRNKVQVEQGCLYCVAINKRNAVKKFAKQLGIKVRIK